LRVVSGGSDMYSNIFLEFNHNSLIAATGTGKFDVYIPEGSIYLTEFPEVKSGWWWNRVGCVCTSS
jgi:hypothetical protein